MNGLTQRQAEALQFIENEIAAGRSPSVAEIAAGMGLKSKSPICRLLDALEERGKITRIRGRARSIRIVREKITCPHCRHEFSPHQSRRAAAAKHADNQP